MCSPKRISDSLTTHVEILMPADLNGYNRLFGGRLMQWIDVVAGVVARRHSGCEVTTASVDQLEFQAPAFVNDTIAMEGRITHVGRTSMEVRVDTFVESLGGERRQVNRAYLVMVALDPKTHKPTPVPSLLLETEEDFAEWEAGNLRAKAARHGGASKTGLERALAAEKARHYNQRRAHRLVAKRPPFLCAPPPLAFRALLGYNKAVCGKGGA